ncbi:MAG: hypothetical protein WBD41_03855 [Rhodococcus sp. (in: high G+C Gram-positive bacteria)]
MSLDTVVHRYQIAITDNQIIELPLGSKPISAATSRSIPGHGLDLWVRLDPAVTATQLFAIRVAGTGHTVSAKCRFIDTVVEPNGLVWHVFYRDLPRRPYSPLMPTSNGETDV